MGKGGVKNPGKNADVFYIWSLALVALLPPCVRPTTNKLPFFLASFWDQTQGFTHLRVIRRIFFFGYFYVSISSISRRWYHQTFYDYHKGQTISKANYGVLNSSWVKKMLRTVSFVRFWENGGDHKLFSRFTDL